MKRPEHRPSSAEEQMILLSAGTASRREAGREQAAQLGASVDWSRVAALLDTRRLLPTLGPRVIELAGGDSSEEFSTIVTRALDAGRRQGAVLQLIAERVTAALTGAGIRCSPLKGPSLSEVLYGDLGRRPSADIDLLVAPEQLHRAVEVVRGLGYAAPTDHVEDDGLPLLHFTLIHEDDQLPPVELHWRIHWYEQSFARDRLLVPSEGPTGRWRPAPLDELIALLLFYARDGFISLRYAVDIGAWWDAFGASLQPGALEESIRAYPALGPVLLAAARVAEKTVGLPSAHLAKSGAKLGVRGRIAVRLADPYPHSSEAQLYADIGLIDGLLAPRGGFRAFVKRQVAPREAEQEHALEVGWARGSSTMGHSVRVLSRYGLAMIRLLGGS
ncbi:MAG: nucleotidyltransferase family protein [Solirubrobacteraceae bacterium]